MNGNIKNEVRNIDSSKGKLLHMIQKYFLIFFNFIVVHNQIMRALIELTFLINCL